MKDTLGDLRFYQSARVLFSECWGDTEILRKDFRGEELAKQLIRSTGSVPANIEEGYGRGYTKEYSRFLRISRGSARETKGWYERSGMLLPPEIISLRIDKIEKIIGALTNSIRTIETRKDFHPY
jgi:four helix bundle protein